MAGVHNPGSGLSAPQRRLAIVRVTAGGLDVWVHHLRATWDQIRLRERGGGGEREESAELRRRRGEVEAEGTGRNRVGFWLMTAGTGEIVREVEIGK
jgi:hypothetical protein